mmetsp:Transcript_102689/g.199038  ORF Transcript_102689/g.199038 Transcript_102689/m.199038 type:complete len:306 (-) Transcript_102689:11-928(-)
MAFPCVAKGTEPSGPADAASIFREQLRALQAVSVAQADAAKALDKAARDYANILLRECGKLEEERKALHEERSKLEVGRAFFEKERQRYLAGGSKVPVLEVPSVEKSGSGLLAAAASMRTAGFEDFRSHSSREPRSSSQPGSFRYEERSLPHVPAAVEVIRAFSVPLEYAVTVGDHSYTVLPPRPVNDSRPGHDMVGQTVVVPQHWEVLSTDADDFNATIKTLAAKSWGTLRLCVRNREAISGFSSYSTILKPFGMPGERLLEDRQLLESPANLEEKGNRSLRFTEDLVSCRIVIRTTSSRCSSS